MTLLDRTAPDDAPCGFPEGHSPRSEILRSGVRLPENWVGALAASADILGHGSVLPPLAPLSVGATAALDLDVPSRVPV